MQSRRPGRVVPVGWMMVCYDVPRLRPRPSAVPWRPGRALTVPSPRYARRENQQRRERGEEGGHSHPQRGARRSSAKCGRREKKSRDEVREEERRGGRKGEGENENKKEMEQERGEVPTDANA